MQGFLLSKPLPGHEIERLFLGNHRKPKDEDTAAAA